MDGSDSKRSVRKGGRSLARPGGGFSVGPSPLNGVKLELAVVFCVLLVLWLGLEVAAVRTSLQLSVLGGAASLGAVWLALRVRRVLRLVDRAAAPQSRGPA